jgi:hypothetical protein
VFAKFRAPKCAEKHLRPARPSRYGLGCHTATRECVDCSERKLSTVCIKWVGIPLNGPQVVQRAALQPGAHLAVQAAWAYLRHTADRGIGSRRLLRRLDHCVTTSIVTKQK